MNISEQAKHIAGKYEWQRGSVHMMSCISFLPPSEEREDLLQRQLAICVQLARCYGMGSHINFDEFLDAAQQTQASIDQVLAKFNNETR